MNIKNEKLCRVYIPTCIHTIIVDLSELLQTGHTYEIVHK